MKDNAYDSLSHAINALTVKGFTHSFEVTEGGRECTSLGKHYGPDELTIVGKHRFEGPSATDDNSVLYALEAKDGTKGLIVDAYGVYADPDKSKFLKNIPVNTESQY